ncbi:MAG: 2,3-bisphosphoglycerate-independent phosphoglycerate mutase [Oscillospiraceae bacterium]
MRPVFLIIMDGYGLAPNVERNALNLAYTPNLKNIFKNNPYTTLAASGSAVGLPDGQMGNSEVGHINIGAGRIVDCTTTRLFKAIADESFFEKEVLVNAFKNCRDKNSTLHIMGLVSDGGVHSHIDHLFALLQMAKQFRLKKVKVHGFLDGRDTPPTSGIDFVKKLQSKMNELKTGKAATLVGRYFAMDRDNHTERIKVAYDAVVKRDGKMGQNPELELNISYKSGETDEFVKPLIFDNEPMSNEDSVVFFNFRADRARQLTEMFFSGLDPRPSYFVCMADYGVKQAEHIAFEKEIPKNGLSECVAKNGLLQLKVAETEKYAHVTYFFNGGVEKPFEGEDRIFVQSPKVKTYDLKPEMSAFEITEAVFDARQREDYKLIVINYANCDMVGHTGNFKAAVLAAKAVDECVGKIIKKAEEIGAVAIITADHGNAEKMRNEQGDPFTAHTCNKVPFVLVGAEKKLKLCGKLCDIAPTILELLGIKKPYEMTGKSLLC